MKLILFKILDLLKNILSKLGINKRTAGIGVVYNFLIKEFWPYKDIIDIQGSKMYLNIKNESPAMIETFSTYAFNKIHERATTELFKKVVKRGDTVIDLGANIGYFSLLAAKIVGQSGKVYSFEPEPKNYSYLTKNININNYIQVSAFQKAVSDKNGKIKLYICDYDSGHHTIDKYEGIEAYSRGRATKEHSIEIETVRLDDIFQGKEESIGVIKMDVEGAEALALAGMDTILRKNKKLKMFIEFFPLLIEKMGNSPNEFIRKIFEDYRFSVYIIPDDYNASKGEMKKIHSVGEVMSFRKEEEDHINLFLEHDENNKISFKKN